MKGIYWRPNRISRIRLSVITALALGGLFAVEAWPTHPSDPYLQEKLEATSRTVDGMERIKQERLARGHTFDKQFDPTDSGMIGDSMSLVTSVPGNLRSKQTSVNPNFAAAVVQMLREAGVESGDTVAVGCSGSFPALNLAVYSALETMRVKPIIVASAGASQFGANMPDMLWIDMERLLFESGHISFRSLAASYGGYEDCGRGMGEASHQLLQSALDRNGLELIDETDLAKSIQTRMKIYRDAAGGEPIAAYINVGGGAASVGRTVGKKLYRPGLNLTAPSGATEIDSVMTRHAKAGVPLVHLVEICELAESLGLPEAPQTRPAIGVGGVFQQRQPRRWLAAIVLLAIVLGLQMTVFAEGIGSLCRWLASIRCFRQVAPRLCVAMQQSRRGDATGELMV